MEVPLGQRIPALRPGEDRTEIVMRPAKAPDDQTVLCRVRRVGIEGAGGEQGVAKRFEVGCRMDIAEAVAGGALKPGGEGPGQVDPKRLR